MLARPQRPGRRITSEFDPSKPHGELPSVGATLCDRYRLDGAVARGASAVVYRATDLVLGEVVAIKVLLPDGVFSTPEARAGQLGFREEAISAMRLGHPAILRVFNYERSGDLEFLVMEFVVGETLSQLARRRPQRRLSTLETIQIGLECLDGLSYAHDVGIIHNDIKPSNLLMTRAGAIKICDFGLARVATTAVAQHVIAGTPGYMSPEILNGRAGDVRSDLFSLAATLYALGNGCLMVPRDAAEALRWQRPPRSPHLPLEMDEMLAVAAALHPEDRFQSAQEMRAALVGVRTAVSDQHARFSVYQLTAEPAQPEELVELDSSVVVDVEGEVTEPRAQAPALELDDMIRVAGRPLRSAYGGDVEVAGFLIDRTPVTNGDYAAFLRATGASPPAHWIGGQPPAHGLEHPVVGVSLEEARAYASWRGRRLPTSAEWECAARGPEATAFPWGDAWDAERCRCPGDGVDGTCAVDEHPLGATAEGCIDMVGNVWEWTEADPRLPPPEEGAAWVFGGSYRHACVRDGAIARSAVATTNSYEYLGFRCAASGGR
jgi:formylglycine-generating enzyme required for sulfatase activity